MTLTQLFTNIANAIRSKKGTSETIVAENFPSEINSIVTPNLQSKSVSITQNGATTVTPDNNYNGLSEVAVTTNVTSEYNTKITPDDNLYSSSREIYRYITKIKDLDLARISSCYQMFRNCISLQDISIKDVPLNITNVQNMFYNCTSLVTAPYFDTSNVTSMSTMFSGCTSLTTIPLFDTSSVTSMASMFTKVTALTDQSLDNILQMCIGANSYTGTKTLSALSLGNVPDITTRVPQLPHYQDFLDAGWTIGIS